MTADNWYQGVFGRGEVTPEQAVLRLYPHTFDPDLNSNPVLALVFVRPQFTYEDYARRIGREYEIEVFNDRIEIFDDHTDGPERVFRGDAVSMEWRAYDLQDFAERVGHLEQAIREHYDDWLAELGKNNRAISLITEMLRRAQIKADASDDQKRPQAAVIAALERALHVLQQDKRRED